MPKLSAHRRESRRQQILDAALRCFARDGFHATTTADIVRESDLSQGALYLYFSSKEDIIVALADDRQEREVFVTALAQREQDPVTGLFRVIELHGSRLTDPENAELRRVWVQGWGEALRNPRIQASINEGLSRVGVEIERLIVRGQRTGQIRPELDSASAVQTLIAAFHGLLLQMAWGHREALSGCGAVLHDMIFQSWLTPAGRVAVERSDCSPPPSSPVSEDATP